MGEKNSEEKLYDCREKLYDCGNCTADEITNLTGSITNYVLPRLKIFRDNVRKGMLLPSDCKNVDEWKEILNKMILAFEEIQTNTHDTETNNSVVEHAENHKWWKIWNNKKEDHPSDKITKKLNIIEGLNLFAEHFKFLQIWTHPQ